MVCLQFGCGWNNTKLMKHPSNRKVECRTGTKRRLTRLAQVVHIERLSNIHYMYSACPRALLHVHTMKWRSLNPLKTSGARTNYTHMGESPGTSLGMHPSTILDGTCEMLFLPPRCQSWWGDYTHTPPLHCHCPLMLGCTPWWTSYHQLHWSCMTHILDWTSSKNRMNTIAVNESQKPMACTSLSNVLFSMKDALFHSVSWLQFPYTLNLKWLCRSTRVCECMTTLCVGTSSWCDKRYVKWPLMFDRVI